MNKPHISKEAWANLLTDAAYETFAPHGYEHHNHSDVSPLDVAYRLASSGIEEVDTSMTEFQILLFEKSLQACVAQANEPADVADYLKYAFGFHVIQTRNELSDPHSYLLQFGNTMSRSDGVATYAVVLRTRGVSVYWRVATIRAVLIGLQENTKLRADVKTEIARWFMVYFMRGTDMAADYDIIFHAIENYAAFLPPVVMIKHLEGLPLFPEDTVREENADDVPKKTLEYALPHILDRWMREHQMRFDDKLQLAQRLEERYKYKDSDEETPTANYAKYCYDSLRSKASMSTPDRGDVYVDRKSWAQLHEITR